jgi:glycosyltransferase involved in cell wall biosynthesis
LGFLSRISSATGFDTLVSAFIELKHKPQLAELKLYATGGYNHDDKPLINRMIKKLKKHGFHNDIKIFTPFDPGQRFDFLSSLSVLCVPLTFPEAFGIFIIESLASGVPVVVPESGACSEIIKATAGGYTYNPARFDGLVQRLETLLAHPKKAQNIGGTGRKKVLKKFSLDTMASHIVKVYHTATRR